MLLFLYHVLAFIYHLRILLSDGDNADTGALLLDCDSWRALVTWTTVTQAVHFGLALLEDCLHLLQGDNGALQKFLAISRNHYFTCYIFPQGTCVSVMAYFVGAVGNFWTTSSCVILLFMELLLRAHKYPSNRVRYMMSTSLFCFATLYTVTWMHMDSRQPPSDVSSLFLLIFMSCVTPALYAVGEYVTSVAWVMHRLLETLHNPQGLVGHNTFGIDGGPSQSRSRMPRGTPLQKARVIFGNGSFSVQDANVHLNL